MVPEDRTVRIKRLRMRSWRRGTKEMDLVLGPYSDKALETLSDRRLAAYETLLSENDIDLYLWFTGATEAPGQISGALEEVRRFHAGRLV